MTTVLCFARPNKNYVEIWLFCERELEKSNLMGVCSDGDSDSTRQAEVSQFDDSLKDHHHRQWFHDAFQKDTLALRKRYSTQTETRRCRNKLILPKNMGFYLRVWP